MSQEKLLSWYDQHKRDLPWRHTSDPFAIWLSEIMLQQTTVETVIPYYERFLKKFPSLKKTASANPEELTKLWSGLGYYRRIQNFQKACRRVEQEFSGILPKTKTELMQLPGIGDYTASAIASIAFQQREVVVDGNVLRVVTRLLGSADSIQKSETKNQVRSEALNYVSTTRPGDSNQALMELGATVCLPTKPKCPTCPLQENCLACKNNLTKLIPNRGKKTTYETVALTAWFCTYRGRLLMKKRSKPEIMAGMWELPCTPQSTGGELIGSTRHAIMNQRYQIEVRRGTFGAIKQHIAATEWKWFGPNEIKDQLTTTMTKKILACIVKKLLPPFF